MSFKDNGFGDRLSAAADARKAAIEKFKAARPGPDDPVIQERQAARTALNTAREIRARERAAAHAKAAEAERVARLEREARERALAAEREKAEALAAADRAEREAALDAERKVARDARYAARKARR